MYRLYKKQIFQAFSKFEATGKFSEKFHRQIDSYVISTRFKVVGVAK